MKKYIYIPVSFCLLIISCSKSGTEAAPAAEKFMSYSAGSTWSYQQINNTPPTTTTTYTLTSTNRDSTVNGKAYHVFTNSSNGSSEYYFNSGADYYTYQKLPDALGGTKVENLYLKDNAAVNTTWTQTYNISFGGFPLVVTTTNKIKEKDITKTVNSISYTGVIHVETTISIPGVTFSTQDVQTYYAPKKGLIQNINIVTISAPITSNVSNLQTNLLTATIL